MIFPKSITARKKKYLLRAEFPVDTHLQLGVYQGAISAFDILIKYRLFIEGEWTETRNLKPIHWAVGILIKQNEAPETMDRLLSFLLDYWNNYASSMKTEEEINRVLDTKTFLDEIDVEAINYPELAEKGEYSVKFLIVLAKLLMLQEKTNNENAYMFKTLLEQLKEHKDIYKIVSTATHNAKRKVK